jgi:L-ascorbate metabolism protein UlaG (beta-lactamase superfamily)
MNDSSFQITHIGGPTALIEVGGWRLLTDPTFDPPGKRYFFGWGTMSRKLAGPAIEPSELGRIDGVLLSHDHHADNLDPAGRSLLPSAGAVITTEAGAARLGLARARGLAPWNTTRLEAEGRPTIEITATPARHGPPGSRPIVGDVIGFALRWDGQQHGELWISGDTVLYAGVRDLATRLTIGTAIVHLGGVRFPVSGPLRYTMTAGDAVDLCGELEPHTILPIHYEGWKHFRQGRDEAKLAFDAAPPAIREHVRWLELGVATEIDG